MIIVSDCLRQSLDEGCIKLASTLAKKLKQLGATVIAANCDCDYADIGITANKSFTNKELYKAIRAGKGDILYIPFASNTLGTAIRVLNLTFFAKKKVSVVFTMKWDMNFLTWLIFNISGCQMITISEGSYDFFKSKFPKVRMINIKTGVDSTRFCPVSDEKKAQLRKKYSLPEDKIVLLHVGHLKYGRNVNSFLALDDKYYTVLVFSSVTEKDAELQRELEKKDNIKVIYDYLPNVEEIYQASDIYVFPIMEENNSIDIPLSVLEAAGCNLRILTTSYNEVAYFKPTQGLNRVDVINKSNISELVDEMLKSESSSTREIAVMYDWSGATEELQKFVERDR